MSLLQGVVAGWLGRRALELGGLLGSLAAGYFALPPGQQQVIQAVLTGNWQGITLGAVLPLLGYLASQVMSFRATVKDQIVVDGRRVRPAELGESRQVVIEEMARTAIERKSRRPGILERLFGRR